MKKGENAIFTIPLELAYGESGSPPTIPPNTIAKGKKWNNPKDLAEVLVKYETLLEDGTVISKFYGVEFTVKDRFLCPALPKVVKTMKKREKALLTMKPQYGFGDSNFDFHSIVNDIF
ncbi:hypothetical protein AAC387_Pa09g0530 [Persea americana]